MAKKTKKRLSKTIRNQAAHLEIGDWVPRAELEAAIDKETNRGMDVLSRIIMDMETKHQVELRRVAEKVAKWAHELGYAGLDLCDSEVDLDAIVREFAAETGVVTPEPEEES